MVDRGGLERLDKGDTALETALGVETELEVTNEPLEADRNGGFKKPGGTFTEPHVGKDANPFGAGETRLEASGFLLRFCTDFPSICFTGSNVEGGLEAGSCGLGTLNSSLLEPSFISIARRLGAPLLESAPLEETPPSKVFFNLLKHESHTR